MMGFVLKAGFVFRTVGHKFFIFKGGYQLNAGMQLVVDLELRPYWIDTCANVVIVTQNREQHKGRIDEMIDYAPPVSLFVQPLCHRWPNRKCCLPQAHPGTLVTVQLPI